MIHKIKLWMTLPDVRPGQKWDMAEEVKDLNSCLYFKDIVITNQAGRSGLVMKKHEFFYKVLHLRI